MAEEEFTVADTMNISDSYDGYVEDQTMDLTQEVDEAVGLVTSQNGNHFDEDDMLSITESSIDEEVMTRQKTFTQKERVEMIHLRGKLEKINDKVRQKQYLVNKQREELKFCRERVQTLDMEEHSVKRQMSGELEQGNMSVVYRLRSQLTRITQEKQGERDLEAHILSVLENLEYDLTLAHIEQGKYLLEDAGLKEKENDYSEFQVGVAESRKMKERKFAQQTAQFYNMREMRSQKMKELEEIKERLTKEKIKAAHEKHNRFLKETMDHIRAVKKNEEEMHREDLQKKIKSVVNLKGDITKNRENMTSLQARDRAMSAEALQRKEDLRTSVEAEGGDSTLAVLREQRKMDSMQKFIDFKRDQREKEVQFTNKIYQEDRVLDKKKRVNPELFITPQSELRKRVQPHKHRKLEVIKSLEYEIGRVNANATFLRDDPDHRHISDDESTQADDDEADSLAKFAQIIVQDRDDGVEDLAQPEFEGLWDKHTTYTIPKEEPVNHIKDANASKMDQEIMRHVLERHRANIVTKQVAAGREFKGQSFYSKPDVIHFKDFEVNKVYKKRVILTNVSYTVSYLKMIGITERLKDFVTLEFDPPGQLSAGMSCDLHVTFAPKINEDLKGVVSFLSQTGPFEIPLRCTTKKVDLSVDKNLIDFGTSVIGETLKQTFILKNNGAKGTSFEFCKESEKKLEGESTMDQFAFCDTEDNEADKQDSSVEIKTIQKSQLEEMDETVPQEQTEATISLHQTDLMADPLDCVKITGVTRSELPAFGQVKLELTWTPNIPDKTDITFVISFEEPDASDPYNRKMRRNHILVRAVGHAIDVPVWIEKSTVDMKICMYDRLYQDTLVVNNRASTALALKFEVCPQLKNHIELLPKTGFIQAHSQFSAQIKFLPRLNLAQDAGSEYFDAATGVLEVPMVIRVANQTRPVQFTVQAVVTRSDLELSVESIDFQCCTIYETVIETITLTNKSILPQQFGFVDVPDYVEIQPNDGFGTLLPQETIELDVLFSPNKAKEFNFNLHCKSLINRSLYISCRGVGVHTPMDLSSTVINFPATAINDVSRASIYVINNHTSMNQYSHPVPRIGSGEIVPMGPTSFEFVPPPNCPVKISPCVGTLEPGKRERIHIRYAPFFTEEEIRAETCRTTLQRLEADAQLEYEQYVAAQKKAMDDAEKSTSKKTPSRKGKPSSTKGKGGKSHSTEYDLSNGPRPVEAQLPENVDPESDDYAAGQASLMRLFDGDFQTVRIPCYIASGACPLDPGTLKYSSHNILYLEVHCPTVRPKLMVISNSGRCDVKFGGICIGQSINRSVTVQNISNETLQLSSNVLDPNGPFQLLNALRPLVPQASHTLQLQFTCLAEQTYHEVLHINTGTSKLAIKLHGKGVNPILQLSGIEQESLYMGAGLLGEYLERVITVTNPTEVVIHVSAQLDSVACRDRLTNHPNKKWIGVQNNSGKAVFDCVPAHCVIKPGAKANITVTFAPDHPSDLYSDGIRLILFGQRESHSFRVHGQCKLHQVFVTGGDPIHAEKESLGAITKPPDDEPKVSVASYLLTFGALMQDDGSIEAAHRVLNIGCVRTMIPGQKRNGDFTFENLQPIQALGFSIDPQKGQVEAGSTRPVQFTWTPPQGHDSNTALDTSILVTTKGDVVEQVKIILRAIIVSDRSTVPDEIAIKTATSTTAAAPPDE